jgi:hypothetical protein
VRRAPPRSREHSKKPPPAADTAHRAPILPVFLGGKHRLVDCAKLHFAPFSSIIEEKVGSQAGGCTSVALLT